MKPPFSQLVDAHGPSVLAFCRAMAATGSGLEAEDLWSETFLSALRGYPSLPEGVNAEAWLITIARRRAVDAHRAATRRRARDTAAGAARPPAADPAGGGMDPVLADAVAALPERQRTAVVLHHVAGLAYAQVAEVTGGTAAASRRAAADGIATLRLALGDRGREAGR